jgi:hypothetical protein
MRKHLQIGRKISFGIAPVPCKLVFPRTTSNLFPDQPIIKTILDY